jgi:ADP-heptose:LPS heptosyltransferase
VVYLDEDTRPLPTILRELELDVLFFPRPQFSEVWAAVRAGIPKRVGSAYRWYAPLFTTRVPDHRSDAHYHEAEYNVRMVARAFNIPMPRVRLVAPRPIVHAPSARPRIIIHPGSGGSARDWPAERFAELAQRCVEDYDAEILITGIASERALCDIVHAGCPSAVNLCGTLDLDGLIDTIAASTILCANSTGVLHVAASCGIGVVGFFPSTPSMSAQRWGPYTDRAVVLESGPGDDMTAISVDAAVQAVGSLLQR